MEQEEATPETKTEKTAQPPIRLQVFEYCDLIKEEQLVIETKVKELLLKNQELASLYSMYYDRYNQANLSLNKLNDVNQRYQAIIKQLLPMLSDNVKQGVTLDMKSIQVILDQPIVSQLSPPMVHDLNLVFEGDKLSRGRPKRTRDDDLVIAQSPIIRSSERPDHLVLQQQLLQQQQAYARQQVMIQQQQVFDFLFFIFISI